MSPDHLFGKNCNSYNVPEIKKKTHQTNKKDVEKEKHQEQHQ